MIMDQAGPRRRLVRRRKNLPPAPAPHPHHLQVPPQPQLPQRLLKPDNLSNDSQHLKVLWNILLESNSFSFKSHRLVFGFSETFRKANLNDIPFQAEQRLIRQKVKRKKRPSYISGGGGKNTEVTPTSFSFQKMLFTQKTLQIRVKHRFE